ncbi:casein kinase I isoform delta [Purpureocillium lavendulum]|uniref:non-specific serine/threonine protein kinase n=1 Tax=Purpureocillium lavendulum TaxID=1247861 RepID=A0AB34FK11_9HYPO|nr:casein kinase I isoform delta [Purpureocillium lavendulum]
MKDIVVNGRYRVNAQLGEGGFGLVYDGHDIMSKDEVAIKLVHIRDDPRILEDEASIYRALAGGPGIPRIFWYGQQDDYYVLVQELLGPSLEDLFNFCGRRFSLKTVLLVADQAISRIKYIHDKHYLHHDIKPDNFLMGVGRRGNMLYTIDFGLAQEFSGLASEGRSHGRTLRYASINNHNKRKQSWCDDLESLGYVLLYLIRGSLPWQGRKAASEEEKDDLIKDMKTNTSPSSLCEGLPEEFAIYLGYVRSLGFEDRPDYAYLRRLFDRLFVSRGFKHDNVFDWTEKRFSELHGLAVAP